MSKLITQEQLDEFAHSVGAHVAAKVLAGLEAAGRLKPQVATTTTIGPSSSISPVTRPAATEHAL